MRDSKLITVGLSAVIAVSAAGLVAQHNQLVAQAEQLAATSFELKTQKDELLAHAQRLQAERQQLSAANVAMRGEAELASQQELPGVVVSAPRYSSQAR
jgi:uncharacterized coiled-coil DUF342 family protein